jgi:hypothetical protein
VSILSSDNLERAAVDASRAREAPHQRDALLDGAAVAGGGADLRVPLFRPSPLACGVEVAVAGHLNLSEDWRSAAGEAAHAWEASHQRDAVMRCSTVRRWRRRSPCAPSSGDLLSLVV